MAATNPEFTIAREVLEDVQVLPIPEAVRVVFVPMQRVLTPEIVGVLLTSIAPETALVALPQELLTEQ